MAFYCYIVASGRNGTIYIGQTDNLSVCISQHKQKLLRGFTARYDCDILIESTNPHWRDLYWEACGIHDPSKPYVIAGLDQPRNPPLTPDIP